MLDKTRLMMTFFPNVGVELLEFTAFPDARPCRSTHLLLPFSKIEFIFTIDTEFQKPKIGRRKGDETERGAFDPGVLTEAIHRWRGLFCKKPPMRR